MNPYYEDSQLTLHCGDCRAVLAEMEPDSVDCCVTSPPYYGLRKYAGDQDGVWESANGCEHEWGEVHPPGYRSSDSHPGALQHEGNTERDGLLSHTCRLCGAWRGGLGLEPTVEMYVNHIVEVFRLVKRVLKPTGSLWLNIGDAYAQQGGKRKDAEELERDRLRAIEKGYPTDAFAGYKGWDRACRTTGSGLKPKDLMLVPFRLALALQADGWWVRSDIIWAKNNPMPESVTDRPTKSHEYIFLLTKRGEYYFDQEAVREAHLDFERGNNPVELRGHSGPSGGLLSGTREAMKGVDSNGAKRVYNPAGRNIRTVWTIPTEPTPMAHFATYPQELVKRCILAGTSERGVCAKCGKPWERTVDRKPMVIRRTDWGELAGNRTASSGTMVEAPASTTLGWRPTCACEAPTVPATVLDPFGGSGTTALVARKLGRRAVLIELSEEYCRMAERRVLAVPVPLGMEEVVM